MSQSKVSRIETGRLLPSVVDVEQILSALGVDHATRQELLTLARVANVLAVLWGSSTCCRMSPDLGDFAGGPVVLRGCGARGW